MTEAQQQEIHEKLDLFRYFIREIESTADLSPYRPLRMAISAAILGVRYVIRALEEVLDGE